MSSWVEKKTMTLPSLTISSYDHAENLLSTIGDRFTHVISINDPEEPPPSPLQKHQGTHLILHFHDISEARFALGGYTMPERQDVQRIIKFAEDLDSSSEVLVHCAAGISRSSAAALTVLASKLEPNSDSAVQAMQAVLAIKRMIHPNARMVQFADELLGYGGHLVAAHSSTFQGGGLIWMPPELENLDPDNL